jgi:hypothetical protein
MLILALMAAAAAAPAEGKTEALDDWQALSIHGVGAASQGPIYLEASAGDLDGDGLPDSAYLRLDCAGGVLKQAQYQVKSPRDSASGQATGKRMHKPMTIVKEWGAATPQLMAIKPTYDVKKVEGTGARVMPGEWAPMALANADGLCAAADVAAKRVTKTRSNIQNN